MYGHEYGIAEHVFMVMTALNRELFIQDAELRRGNWGHRGYYRELRGRILLVVGLGHIGAEVVRWGRFVNMRVTGITRSPSPERGQQFGLEALGGPGDLDTYLANADFVVLAVPHTPQTGAMVGRSQLQQMKPTAYLINVARGPVVDEAALYTALKEGAIAGAGIDVWYCYPEPGQTQQMPSTYPFHELDNVILTPHTSGMTDGTFQHRWAAVAENLRRLAAGEPLKNIVWPQQAR